MLVFTTLFWVRQSILRRCQLCRRSANRSKSAPVYDEFLVLRYRAMNEPPYPFEWVDYQDTVQEYGRILTRISRNYDQRF
jgi:hypothetical protein